MTFEPFIAPPARWASIYAGLTMEQAAGIGAVAYTWSIAEAAIEMTLCELAQSPSPLGQALTTSLGPDNRLQALSRLTGTWDGVLSEDRDAERRALEQIRISAKWFAANKAKRNQIVHYIWMRHSNDAIFGMKHDTRPLQTYKQKVDKSASIATTDLIAFASEINEWSDRLFDALRAIEQLPTWPRSYAPPP